MRDHPAIGAAATAARRAAASLSTNGRVALVDVGAAFVGGMATEELAVRVHVVDKRNEVPELELASMLGSSFVDKAAIPYPRVDIIEGAYPLEMAAWSDRFDPLIGGISTSNDFTWGYGTLGCGVVDRGSGRQLALSNWHVYVRSLWAAASVRATQPGLGDDWNAPQIGTVARHTLWSGYDAAVAVIDDDRRLANEQLGLGPINGLVDPQLGRRVMKSGRGSGVTAGVIDGVGGSWFATIAGIGVTIRDVIRIVPDVQPTVSAPGDSGAIWMDLERNALALHFAGGDQPEVGLAMALPQVLDALDVDLLLELPVIGAARAGPSA